MISFEYTSPYGFSVGRCESMEEFWDEIDSEDSITAIPWIDNAGCKAINRAVRESAGRTLTITLSDGSTLKLTES